MATSLTDKQKLQFLERTLRYMREHEYAAVIRAEPPTDQEGVGWGWVTLDGTMEHLTWDEVEYLRGLLGDGD